MKRFLTNDLKNKIDLIIDNIKNIDSDDIKKEVYLEVEYFLRAKYKLEKSELTGTTQQYDKKLKLIFNTLIRTSSFIEAPIEFKIPASYPIIIDIFIEHLRNIFGWSNNDATNVKNIVDCVLDTKFYKLRKKSNGYDNHIDLVYEEYFTDDTCSGMRVTPITEYEIGYTLVPTSNILIENRIAEENDIDEYMNHPLFFTNGI